MEAIAPRPDRHPGGTGRTLWGAHSWDAVDVAVPFVVFGVVALSRATPWYRRVVAEDGLLEWTQVAAFAVAVWATVTAARRAAGAARLAYAAVGLVLLGVIGEELAWGSRLSGTGLAPLEARNEQGDTTLHNLAGGLEASFVGIAVVALTLALAVACRRPPLHTARPALVWWLVVPAVYAVFRVAAGDVPYHVAKYSEAAEAVFAVAVARLALGARRTRVEPPRSE